MDRDINLVIEDLKMDIIDKLNQSNLPISIAYYVLKDVMNELSINYDNYITQARKQEQVNAAIQAAKPEDAPSEENEDN